MLQRAYGGEVIVAPSGVPADHPDHYQNLAVTLCKKNADYFDVDQYDNPHNPEAYYRTLGPEVNLQLVPLIYPVPHCMRKVQRHTIQRSQACVGCCYMAY